MFYELKFYVELGGLASYGPDISAYAPDAAFFALRPLAGCEATPFDVVQALASASIRLTTLPVSRGFTAVRTGSRLRFLVEQLDECVFVAVFKFARFDRLQPEEMLRCKPKFSVSVAIAAVAVAAVTAVAEPR